MCKCSHPNCQFEQFLLTKQNKEIFYFEDEENFDNYCIFHVPLKIKKNFRISQKELYNQLIEDYRLKAFSNKSNIDFSNVIFLDYDFRDKNLTGLEIDLTNATFIKNVRFDNLKCKKLILKDTIFLDGGGIKNREKDKNLFIEELEFRPYSLNGDFVIDIGAYVNENGLLEFDKQGVIEKLKFENHQIGDGRIFFIGLNQYLQKADFTNMVLDKVLFQNCDLKNCYFLNAKIAKTEFRNCYFPQNDNRMFNYDISGRKESIAFLFLFPLILLCGYIFIKHSPKDIYYLLYLLISIIYIPILLASLNVWIEFISYWINKISFNLEKKEIAILKYENSNSFNVHCCIADEENIYKSLDTHTKIKDKLLFQRNKEVLRRTLDSLSSSYSQLKDNFKDKDFQLSGNFFYAQRYTEILSKSTNLTIDWMMFNIHQFTNGFGESYLKPLTWFISTLFIFALPLISMPNKDYISTSATPLFLIKDANVTDGIVYISDRNNTKNSFRKNLTIETYDQNNSILYGYDNRYDYHIQKQYILALDENQSTQINLIHSFSNMIYPFTPEQKRWFQNVSKEAVYYSLLESILLWYFTIAFVLALWHRIKR